KFTQTGKNSEYTASYTQKGDTLVFKDDWRRRDKTIKASEYSNYRNICTEVLNYTERPVIMLSTGEK
ncbi:MAG: hypothetical protein P8Z50_02240, partial [candidate division WOR-3 bacterium]